MLRPRLLLVLAIVGLLLAWGAGVPGIGSGAPRPGGGRVPGQEVQPGRIPLAPVSPYRVQAPPARSTYDDGPDGRFLMDGTWLRRFDGGVGLRRHFPSSSSTAGWTPVNVPNAFNAQDNSLRSMLGTVVWYRKDFLLPSSAGNLAWVIRFDSVNYRAQVWLNGHRIGAHTGAFLPFELRLPAGDLHRSAANRLVIRVDNRRRSTDFPPGGVSRITHHTAGGWWNYGGLLRDVYLRRVDRLDFQSVQVLPDLPCPTCPGQVTYRVRVRNDSASPQSAHVVSSYGGQPVELGTARISPGATHLFTGSLSIASPHLWSPADPHLYDVTLDANANGAPVAHYFLRSGIRSIRVVAGHLLLNGHALSFRGVGLHEDSPQFGFAIDNAIRRRYISEVKDLGATAIRAHYPLSPYLEELADENGILLWSEIPVYQMHTAAIDQPGIRGAAVNMLSRNILTNASHPSVIVWSIANELSSRPDGGQRAYIRQAVAAAHRLDPTRPVGQVFPGYPLVGCQAAYAPLQVLGINDYFGWYPGPQRQIANRNRLSAYLDRTRSCYPNQALVVTEFGAEANRPGPVQKKGTYAFQEDFLRYHLGVFASKPWLSGAIYWALEEFRVRPGWNGGNPRPDPPIFEKGLISFLGHRKPAFFDAQSIYHATVQLAP